MCKKQTSLLFRTVQQNQKSFLWTQDWGWTKNPHLIYGICAVLDGNTYQSNQERGNPCTNLVRASPHKLPKRKKSHGMIDVVNNVDFISSNVNSSRKEVLLYVFEDNEAVIKMIIKGRSPTMRHVSRTHRVALDWLFDRINLDHHNPNQIHWHPKPNSQTHWQRETTHVMNGIIFCVCLTLAVSVLPIVLKRCRKERKKMQVKQNRSRWWIWSRDAAKGLVTCLPLLHQKARRKPDMTINFLWARELSSIIEQGDLMYTLTHQATQNGKLIELGLLKSGHLMNWWKIEHCDLLYSHSTRTDSLLKTMRWILTPTQNQTCRLNPDRSCIGWMIKCEKGRTNPQKMQRKTATNIL